MIGPCFFFLVSKLILFLLCSREKSATLNALAQDHRNDVFSNTVALLCGIVGKRIVASHCHLFSFSPKVSWQEKIPVDFLPT